MRPLIIATENEGKRVEFQRALKNAFEVQVPPKSLNVEETGGTYRENAFLKANAYYAATKVPTLADDSGLEVIGLDNRPGVYSARFGGSEISWPERWALLEEEITQSGAAREAQFRCVLCYKDEAGERYFEGICPGEIIYPPRGDGGFGYDPIFSSHDLKLTFAEATKAQKEQFGHRGLALRKFMDWASSLS